MIVIKVELWSATSKEVTTLHTMILDNVATSPDGKRADYRARIWKRGQEMFDIRIAGKEPIREAMVKDHARLSQPVMALVGKALKALGYVK